jgi:DNA-binding MarR family transcriptional regulator
MSASRRTSPAREVEAVAERFHSAALHLLRRLRAEGDAAGISPPRLSALSVVARSGPVRVGDLAAAEGVEPPTMTRLVDGLEAEGLVARGPDPTDRRAVLVHATAKGRRALVAGRADRVRRLAERLAPLPGEDVAALDRAAELLERLLREP